jgi:dTDP-4-dehydrorhamnose reductase
MLRLGSERDQLKIVNDQIGAPTTSIELADATRKIVAGISAGVYGDPANWAGLYHMTCGGSTSWFGFAQAIFARTGRNLPRVPEIVPISTDEYPTPAGRPANSILSNRKLNLTLKIDLDSWTNALERVFLRIANREAPSRQVNPFQAPCPEDTR